MGDFKDAAIVMCRFGTVDVQAMSLVNGGVLCASPAHAAQAVAVRVSSNGVDWVRYGELRFKRYRW